MATKIQASRASIILAVAGVGLLYSIHASAAQAVHVVTATSFADPKDIRDYNLCRQRGGSPKACLAVGDNGIGLWGDRTDVSSPICALPQRDWQSKWGRGTAARGKKVIVSYGAKTVTCELRDTLGNPKNGAGIDLNPGAAAALGFKPPFKQSGVLWRWAK